MTDSNLSGWAQAAEKAVAGVKGFATEMREKGIHVGMGNPAVCVTCADPWPCEGSKG